MTEVNEPPRSQAAPNGERFGIPTKLTLAFGCLIVLPLFSQIFIHSRTVPVSVVLNQTQQTRVPTARASAEARTSLLAMQSNIRGYLALGDPKFRAAFRSAKQSFESHLGELESTLPTQESHATVSELRELYGEWSKLPEQIFQEHDEPLRREPAKHLLVLEEHPRVDRILTDLNQIKKVAEQESFVRAVTEFERVFLEMVAELRGYLVTLNPNFKEDYEDARRRAEQAWMKVEHEASELDGPAREQIARVASIREEYLVLPKWLLEAAEGDQARRDLYLLRTQNAPLTAKLDSLLGNIVQEQNAALANEIETGNVNLESLEFETMSIVLITVVIGATLAYVFRSRIIQDINRRRQAERAVTETQEELLAYQRRERQRIEQEVARLRDELVRKERLAVLGQLTGTVAHELRNPLATIRGALFLIQKRTRNSELDLESPLERADTNIARCDQIIEELLDYTRTRSLNLESTPMADWLNKTLKEYQFSETIKVRVELDADVEVRIDQERLRRCLVNALNNACDAMADNESLGRDQQLVIAATADEAEVVIRISDNGKGIPADVMDKIFDPLFSTKSFGVGLGLSIVKDIVERHGGRVELESEEGVGTTTTIAIPVGT